MDNPEKETWHVLLVDDDEDDYILTRSMLCQAKGREIKLDWAPDYQKGQHMLKHGRYSAVLVDYDLGAHTGIELIRETAAHGYHAPLILYTGRGNYEVDVEAMQAGATLYLTKAEATPLLLERSLRYAIEHKQLEEALLDANLNLQEQTEELELQAEELREKADELSSVNERLGTSEANLRQVSEQQILLAEAAAQLLAGADPINSLDDFFRRFSSRLGLEVYVQYNVSKDGTHLELGRISGFSERYHKVLARLEFGQAVCGTVALTRKPMYVNDVQELKDRNTRLIRSMGIRTYACHPLIVDDRLLGTLSFGSRSRSRFDPQAIDLLRAFCSLVAHALARKQMEEELFETTQRLQALLQALPVGVSFSKGPDYEHITGNPTAIAQLEASQEDNLSASATDPAAAGRKVRYFQDGREVRDEELPLQRAIVERRMVAPVELEVLLPSGRRWVAEASGAPIYDRYGNVVGGVAVTVDITARKQSEQALRESEERFRTLADHIAQLAWMADESGSITWYNQRWYDFTGTTLEEVAGWGWQKVHHPDHVQRVVEKISASFKSGEVWEDTFPLRGKDGRYRWFLSRAIPIQDESGRVVRWFGTNTDITELLETEQALRENELMLRQYAEKLERSNQALQDFAFIASHDLKEPLRKVRTFGKMLSLNYSPWLDEQGQDYIERMQDAARRMQDMLDGLLELSRLTTQDNQFEEVDLNQTVREVLTDLELRLIETGGQVELGELPTIEADPLQMRQLLQNLITNALKFHREGVKPVVKIFQDLLTSDQGLRTSKELAISNPLVTGNQSLVTIHIQDNGIGFDMEEAKQLFQPFHRLVGRSEYDGSGMGLAICRKIAERHGGSISVHSVMGEGSTFAVTLPVKQRL
jgi:PAS domain S-box-containing protein